VGVRAHRLTLIRN